MPHKPVATAVRHPVKAAAPAKAAAPGKTHAPAGKAAHAPVPAAKAQKPVVAVIVAADAAQKAAPKPVEKGRKGKEKAEKLELKLPASTPEDRQSQLKLLIARGKEQSFLTYAEVNDHLPSEIVDPEQIEDIVQMINDMGIPVYEKAPDAEALLMREPVVADDEAAEEAAQALATTWMPNSAAPPTRCACTCARWARSSC